MNSLYNQEIANPEMNSYKNEIFEDQSYKQENELQQQSKNQLIQILRNQLTPKPKQLITQIQAQTNS